MISLRVVTALLFGLLAPAVLAAPPSWHRATSRHFIVYSAAAPDQLRTMTRRLERFDEVMRYRLGLTTDDAGKPFFTASDKLIKMMFSNDLRDDTSEYSILIPRLFEFKVSRMVVDGNLIF